MKNKKWKRKAKRLKGYCLSVRCEQCILWKNTGFPKGMPEWNCTAPLFMPKHIHIRELERECKYGNS